MKNSNKKIVENSRKKIDTLLSFAEEELNLSLNKLIIFQIHKYRWMLNQIHSELKRFETEHKMSSENFYTAFESGKIGDDADYFEWSSLYEDSLLYNERIRALEAALKSKT